MCYLIPQVCDILPTLTLLFIFSFRLFLSSLPLNPPLPHPSFSLSFYSTSQPLPVFLFPSSSLLPSPSSLLPLSSSSPAALPGLLLTVLSDRIEYAQLTEDSIKQSSLLENLPILVNTSADPVTGMCVICVGECPPSGGSRGGSVGSMEPPF